MRTLFVSIACVLLVLGNAVHAKQKPNVILILVDDQGIGDLACHGNPWVKTPNIDRFYAEAVRMTDFHVSPLCTPTRGAIMTGQYPINNGAWATYKGRDALSGNATTMADIFKSNGYATALFGKWHLGDNYPVRPTDCGFDYVVQHKSGGVGELSDYWGNTYFDDTYFVNNKPQQFKGYCTDVWFSETMKYIKNHTKSDNPFFIYLPTNAVHSPFYVEEKYSEPYKALEGLKIPIAEYYGMVTNMDYNFGRLEHFLKKQNLDDNTILIYMTDNGSGGGVSKDGKLGYNFGFRGKKGAKTEGGHRVPFFIRWKDGNIAGGLDCDEEVAHIDLIPTLAKLCNINLPEKAQLDGIDFSKLLTHKKHQLKDRSIFVHHRQDWRQPKDVEQSCIIKNSWRLVNGNELYDIDNDRFQQHNLAAEYPEVVSTLLLENALFLEHVKQNRTYYEMPVSIVGNPAQRTVTLTIQHAIGEGSGIWKPEQVAAGMKNTNNQHAIEVEKEGWYTISCRRWPMECPGPIQGIPTVNPKNFYTYKSIKPKKVRIAIENQILEKEVDPEADEVLFKVHLNKGKTLLTNDFIEGKEKYGVYYTYITPVD